MSKPDEISGDIWDAARSAMTGLAGYAERSGHDLQADIAHAIHAAVEAERERQRDMLAALRSIAEGNLGDEPWQANYEKIRRTAADAIRSPTDRIEEEEHE